MERKDAFFLLLLAAGGGYAAYTNWETISTTLGLDDIAPGRVKAITLAQEEYTFDRGRNNYRVLQSWVEGGAVEVDEQPWSGDRVDGDHFVVVCRFRYDGELRVQTFDVDVGTGVVTPREPLVDTPR